MDLLVVRHAEAITATGSMPDDIRPLSTKGRASFSRLVKRLRREGIRVERILHSPLLRAMETADLLAPLLSDAGETEVTPHLVAPVSNALLERIRGTRVAVVGHQPWLGELCAWLVTGGRGTAGHFDLAKGGVARLTGEPVPGGMRLEALLEPGDDD